MITKREYRIYQRGPTQFDAELAQLREDQDRAPQILIRTIGESYSSLQGAKSACKRYARNMGHPSRALFEWKQVQEDYWTSEGNV